MFTYEIDTTSNMTKVLGYSYSIYLLRADGTHLYTLWPSDIGRGWEWCVEYYFDVSCWGEAQDMMRVLFDELKERGLLPM